MSDKSKTRAASYEEAGVSLSAAQETVGRYRKLVHETHRSGVLSGIGGFGALFSLKDAGVQLNDPVLVSGTDGVGTKLKLAIEMGKNDTIGIDCVAMCVNDIVVTGAEPLFFLDYLATGRLDPSQAESIVSGISKGCVEAGCALVGGETAEMPGFYADGDYDVAGFCVGVVERSMMLGPERVKESDVLIGLASSGFHSNGYSLIRKIIADHQLSLSQPFGEGTLGEALLEPTVIYSRAIRAIGGLIHSAAHITGGGIEENLPRALPEGFGARIDQTWEVPAVIEFIVKKAGLSREECMNIFNMGIGMILAVPAANMDAVMSQLEQTGYRASRIGVVTTEAGIVF